jgi:hypothetical protein
MIVNCNRYLSTFGEAKLFNITPRLRALQSISLVPSNGIFELPFSNYDARGHILTFFTAFGKIASDERRRVILRVAGLAFCKRPFGQLGILAVAGTGFADVVCTRRSITVTGAT